MPKTQRSKTEVRITREDIDRILQEASSDVLAVSAEKGITLPDGFSLADFCKLYREGQIRDIMILILSILRAIPGLSRYASALAAVIALLDMLCPGK
ncbi:MAG: hypothetical protein A2Z04_08845 [Chloroflexi bacterium RBG_16_57_9]|nr:MAG: hypothetical protein A2Z04_08845 [Chloroflexi bacterium RBG_16_57_9]